MPDDELMHVLHTLRLLGFADTHQITTRRPGGLDDVETTLVRAESALLVTHRSGRVSGWSLTASGRSHGEVLLASERDRLGATDTVTSAYDRFRAVNQRFLDLCTDWQLFPGDGDHRLVNDHGDPDYDAGVVARLATLDDVIQPLIADLAAALDRFASYGPRFANARRLVVAGDLDWFTRPVIDSYHTVWFELHEDLLATLGLDRSSEHLY